MLSSFILFDFLKNKQTRHVWVDTVLVKAFGELGKVE